MQTDVSAAEIGGATVQFGSTKEGVRSLESKLDRQFESVRVFKKWDSVFPDAEDSIYLSEGRTLLVSIYPRRLDGSSVPWSDIAAASPGSDLYDNMVAWANMLMPYQDQIYVTFNHEPETVKNVALGTAADFQAAWRNLMTIIADVGFEPRGRLFIVTSPSFSYPTQDRRAIEHWYPGDAWADAVGGDAYNFYRCRPDEQTGWAELSDIIEDQRLWGLDHPGVELMLTEVGTVPDPAVPGRNADWLRNATSALQAPLYQQFTRLVYFQTLDTTNPDCDYLNTSSRATQAFYDMVNSPFFGGSPPAIAAPPSQCLQTTDAAGAATISWNPSYEAAGYEVSESTDGGEPTIVATTSELFYIQLNPPARAGTIVYSVASKAVDGQLSDSIGCIDESPPAEPLLPPASCSWMRDAAGIAVDWSEGQGAAEYVVYRTVDGAGPYWQGRTSDLTFTQPARAGTIVYSVASKAVDGQLSESIGCIDESPPAEPLLPLA